MMKKAGKTKKDPNIRKNRKGRETNAETVEEKIEVGKGKETVKHNAVTSKTEQDKTEKKSTANKGIFMPHDKGYKRSLSNPREFLHFIQKYIQEDWMMELSENQISLCDKEFIEKDYEGREADLLYKVVVGDEQEVFIYILQELQSYVDYTMIFRVLVYVVNTLMRHFLTVEKAQRERADFRLSAVVPIVFYNGEETWTPVCSLGEYQSGGGIFGEYVLNLKYYLVNLQEIEEDYILSTNTVIDNIMYCDKFRRNQEIAAVVRKAVGRMRGLGAQEKEEFFNWVRHILLSICDNKDAVVEEILSQAGEGEDDDMAFEYTIIRQFNKEREQIRKEAKIEDILELLEDCGPLSVDLKQTICAQRDVEILKSWHKLAAAVSSPEEFESKMWL